MTKKETNNNGFSIRRQKRQFRSRYSPIGLDLGSNQIKMVQLQHHRGTVTTRLSINTLTPPGTIVDGQIVKAEALIAKLKLVRTKLNLGEKTVNLALCPSVCNIQLVKLPPLTAREKQKVMYWEVEKRFSLNPADTIYDYYPAWFNAAGNDQRVYILAVAAKDTADTYSEVMAEAGFTLAALEALPLSLLRANLFLADQSGNEIPKTLLILDIGYRQSTLLIVHKRAYQFQQTLNFGVANLIDLCVSNKTCSADQALRFLFRDSPASFSHLEAAYNRLAGQIVRNKLYWFEKIGLDQSAPLGLMLSGGGATIPQLGYYLSKNLNARLFYHQLPLSNHKKDGQKNLCSATTQSLFVTACGLALRGWLA